MNQVSQESLEQQECEDHVRGALRLYAVTDRAWLKGRTLADCVQACLEGGATFVQLREKDASSEEKRELARELKNVCERYQVPFVIDDDVALAREVEADGVHVGQEDMACTQARALLGSQAIIGVSVQTVEQALEAQAQGADYLGVGALIPTSTKPDAENVTPKELAAICAAVNIPVVAIGGLNTHTLDVLKGTGVDGAAVVSAIFAADDCEAAARELRTELEAIL